MKEQTAEVVELKATVAELKTDNEGNILHSTIPRVSNQFYGSTHNSKYVCFYFVTVQDNRK